MPEFTKPNVNRVWADTGSKIQPTDSKIADGWVAEIPSYQHENFIQNRQDQFNAHVNQHGVPEWDSATEYRAGKSYAMGSDGLIYRCLATHTNKNPVSAPDKSTYWTSAFDIAGTSYDKSTTDSRYLRRDSNLADLASPTSARTNLGLGTASTFDVGTGPGQILRVADFGLGRSGTTAQNVDLNSLTATGFFYVSSASQNLPYADSWYVINQAGDTATRKQTAFAASANAIYTRALTQGSWSAWEKLVSRGDFGIGGSIGWQTVDLNNFKTSQFLGVTGSSLNLPVAQYGTVLVEGGGDQNYCKQTFSPTYATKEIYVRWFNNGSWSPWVSLWNSANFNPATKQDALGFSPIEQGGGPYQTNNKLRLGWSANGLRLSVDGADNGFIWAGRTMPTGSAGQSGYVVLPNGIIFQWGMGNFGDVPNVATRGPFRFPMTFPNACATMVVCSYGPLRATYNGANWTRDAYYIAAVEWGSDYTNSPYCFWAIGF